MKGFFLTAFKLAVISLISLLLILAGVLVWTPVSGDWGLALVLGGIGFFYLALMRMVYAEVAKTGAKMKTDPTIAAEMREARYAQGRRRPRPDHVASQDDLIQTFREGE